jgi:hypothetical protein
MMAAASVCCRCDDDILKPNNLLTVLSLPGSPVDNAHEIHVGFESLNPIVVTIWMLTGASIVTAILSIYIMSMTCKPEVIRPVFMC